MRLGIGKSFGFKYEKVMELLFVLYAFICMKPFFTWSTYHNGIFSGILGVSTEMLVSLLICLAGGLYLSTRECKTDKALMILLVGLGVLGFIMLGVCGGLFSNITNTTWLKFFVMALFLLMPDRIKINAFEKFYFLFIITAIIPLIYFVLQRIGINLPYQEMRSYEPIKVEKYFYYKHFPFAVQIANRSNPMIEMRLSGIYDEAGRLGTTAALFLCAHDFNLKKKINILCLVIGVCSFSLAFFLICFAYVFLKAISAKKLSAVGIIIFLCVSYLIFVNLHFDNQLLDSLQSRVEFTDEGLSGDNRSSLRYDILFTEFNRSPLFYLLFGYGFNAIGQIQEQLSIDGSSYKSLIYNFGYVGFGMYMAWILMLGVFLMSKNRKSSSFIIRMIVVMFLNFYQRPTVLSFTYFLIFIGGILYTCSSQNKCSFMSQEHLKLFHVNKSGNRIGLSALNVRNNAKG